MKLSPDTSRGTAVIRRLLDRKQTPRVGEILQRETLGWILRRLQAAGAAPLPIPVPDGDDYHVWTPTRRIAANAGAMTLLERVEDAGRPALPEERATVAAFSGWGGIDPRQINLDRTPLPAEYAAAVREWNAARDERRIPATNLFRGLLDQFFTPNPVCRAMWGLAQRALPITPQYGLEPAAGIGRFLQTTPEDADPIRWSLVESDLLLARMLAILYPEAAVHAERFESFVTTALPQAGRYDLVLMNPPYGKWSRTDLDPAMRPYASDLQDYFVKRALDLLAPGGVMCVVSTAGQIDGTSEAATLLRRFLIADAHLYAAARIGSDIFDRLGASPANGLAISTWIKLPAGGRATVGVSGVDAAFLRGTYFRETDPGRASVLGEWRNNRFGQPVVVGPFDPAAVAGIPGTPLPARLTSLILEARAGVTHPDDVPTTSPPAAASGRPTRRQGTTGELRDIMADAASLETRVARYTVVRTSHPGLAEHGRGELLRDAEEFRTTYGAAALTRIPTLPTVIAALSQSLPQQYVDPPPDTDSVPAIVSWVSSHNGVCLEADVLAYYTGSDSIREAALADADIAVEPLAQGDAYYRMVEYLSGNLYARLDRVAEALAATPEADPLHARLESQRVRLNQELNPRGISDILVTPRSGFVPPGAVVAFAAEKWIPLPPSPASYGWELVPGEGRWSVRVVPPTGAPMGYERREVGALRKGAEKIAHAKMIFLLGYLNRETMVNDGVSPQQFSRYADVDPKAQQAEDADLEAAFLAWAATSDVWRPVIEDTYNRAFFGDRPRDYPSDAVPILRWNPQRVLHPHQNRGARWFEDRRSGLLAWDVGIGKTEGAAAIIARLRQIGRIRRPIVVVPNAVLTNWIRSVRYDLPDYRIGTIGLTYDDRTGFYRSDVGDAGDRARKWRAHAAGAYDVLIVTRSAFKRDVTTRTETQFRILSRIEWLKRGKVADAEDAALTTRRITAATAEIEKKTREMADAAAAVRRKLETEVEAFRAKIARWEAALTEPPKGTLAKLQQMLQDAIARGLFQDAGSEPLVDFEDLECDLLVVDEAHNYKNLYYPTPRYGADSIAYMGTTKDTDDYAGLTIQSWDLYVKALELGERGGGVLLLTATPVKNSPLEVYNLLAYLSPTLWTSREIRTAEEWIDRYLLLEPDEIVTVDGDLRRTLAVTGFNEETSPELDAVLSASMYRITTEQAITLGLIPRALMPEKDEIPADVDMDPVQVALYAQIKGLVRMELAVALLSKEPAGGAVGLSQLDQLGKAALAPMILVDDYTSVAQRLAVHHWLAERTPAPPARITLEYPALAKLQGATNRETEQLRRKIQDLLRSQDCPSAVTIDGPAVLASQQNRVGGWTRPKAGVLAPVPYENLVRRFFFLTALDRDRITTYYAHHFPPKVQALAEAIAGNAGCGHVIFLNASMALFPTIRRALVEVARVRPDRIAEITGALDLAARAAVADAFNGRDADPLTGDPEITPAYDVVIGTDAMAEGVNLQRRTCAVHHLDLPWEPGTLKQRNGRGVRQGNTLGNVGVRYYVSVGSLDMKRKDVIVGKTTWQEALLTGSARGSIELTADWEEVKIREFAATPEEAEEMLREMRARKAAKLRERLVATATRDIAGLADDYRRARLTEGPSDRAIRFQLADARARRIRQTWEKNGLDPTPVIAARDHAVLSWPGTGFYLVEGEHVGVASTDEADDEWYTDPTLLEVVTIHRDGTALTVRPYGQYRDAVVFAGGKRHRTPPERLLTPPADMRSPTLKGTLRRVTVAWDTTADRAAALKKIAAAGTPVVLSARSGGVSAAFRTPADYSAAWTGLLRDRESVTGYHSITSDPSPGGYLMRIPLIPRSPGAGAGTVPEILVYTPREFYGSFAPFPNKTIYWDLLVRYRPLVPGDATDWATYVAAVTQGTLRVLSPGPRTTPATPEVLSVRALRDLTSDWLGRTLPTPVLHTYERDTARGSTGVR